MLCSRILKHGIFTQWQLLEAMHQNIHYEPDVLDLHSLLLLESGISCLINAGLPEMKTFSLL